MARKNKTDNESTGTEVTVRKGKIPLLKLILIIVAVLLVLSAAVAGWVFYMINREAPVQNSNLPPETMQFMRKMIPELYTGYSKLDEEMVLTAQEMTRIEKISEIYPEQKKIPDTEYRLWESNLKALVKTQSDFEKNIQIIYVSFQVNQTSGTTLIEEKKDLLKQNLEEQVVSSKQLTDRLRELELKKPFITRMKAKIFKGTQ